jgi:hypothetical protein
MVFEDASMPRYLRSTLKVGLLLVIGISFAAANSNPSSERRTFIGLQNVRAVDGTYSGVSFSSNFLVPPNNLSCTGFPSYCNWTSATLGLSGTAKSVTFTKPANGHALSDLALNSTTSAVPEVSSLCLLITGLGALGLGCFQRFRK